MLLKVFSVFFGSYFFVFSRKILDKHIKVYHYTKYAICACFRLYLQVNLNED